jgi:hypothetical protein
MAIRMSPSPTPLRIIPTSEWGAAPAKGKIAVVGKPDKILFHHTAGHHPNLDADSGESYAEAVAYAKAIQRSHFSRGWLDTGNNFLVTRNGYIFEGRHGSLKAINAGRMVVSAHCPGQNSNPGIEIEQDGNEQMTPDQYAAAVWLFAYICEKTGVKPAAIKGHRDYFATACPGVLYAGLPKFRNAVTVAMGPAPTKPKPWWQKYGPKRKPAWFFKLIEEAQRRAGK